jgi:hypothetical protein
MCKQRPNKGGRTGSGYTRCKFNSLRSTTIMPNALNRMCLSFEHVYIGYSYPSANVEIRPLLSSKHDAQLEPNTELLAITIHSIQTTLPGYRFKAERLLNTSTGCPFHRAKFQSLFLKRGPHRVLFLSCERLAVLRWCEPFQDEPSRTRNSYHFLPPLVIYVERRHTSAVPAPRATVISYKYPH